MWVATVLWKKIWLLYLNTHIYVWRFLQKNLNAFEKCGYLGNNHRHSYSGSSFATNKTICCYNYEQENFSELLVGPICTRKRWRGNCHIFLVSDYFKGLLHPQSLALENVPSLSSKESYCKFQNSFSLWGTCHLYNQDIIQYVTKI